MCAERKAIRGIVAFKGFKAFKATRGQPDLKARSDLLGHRVTKEKTAILDLLVRQDQLAHKDRKAFKGKREQRVRKAFKATQDRQGQRDQQGQQGRKDQQEMTEMTEPFGIPAVVRRQTELD